MSFNKKPIRTAKELVDFLEPIPAGTKIKVTYMREAMTREVELELCDVAAAAGLDK